MDVFNRKGLIDTSLKVVPGLINLTILSIGSLFLPIAIWKGLYWLIWGIKPNSAAY